MAATAAAVAAEEDTELRDLLVQTLEGSGVLNRIKVGAGPGRAWRRGARAAGPVRTAGVTKGPPGRDPGSGPWGGAAGSGSPGPRSPPASSGGLPSRRRVSRDPLLRRRGTSRRDRGARGALGRGDPWPRSPRSGPRAWPPPGCALGFSARTAPLGLGVRPRAEAGRGAVLTPLSVPG